MTEEQKKMSYRLQGLGIGIAISFLIYVVFELYSISKIKK